MSFEEVQHLLGFSMPVLQQITTSLKYQCCKSLEHYFPWKSLELSCRQFLTFFASDFPIIKELTILLLVALGTCRFLFNDLIIQRWGNKICCILNHCRQINCDSYCNYKWKLHCAFPLQFSQDFLFILSRLISNFAILSALSDFSDSQM